MKTLVRSACVALLGLALQSATGVAQAADATPTSGAPGAVPTRPRIGLALSGGGARGIAHVGVLKVLEEMRIPISCVTGTSMGAIVGGTFASGTSPKDMETFVLAADWEEIFRDRPPRDQIAIRRKIDDYKTLFAPEFGVKDGSLALPKGVIAGVSIESFFRVLALPALGVSDFNELPIPFRAMATDIETGDAVVLDRGSVAQAMRASMSVPGAIAPVEIDGKLLVDGGIANNLPIDEARKLCGDVVIAVNISTPPLKRKDITSALTVAAQLVNFLGKQTVDDQIRRLGPGDVLIAPELGDISASTFERSKDAVRIGEEATRAMAPALARYSIPPEQYAALRAKQLAERKSLGTVDSIRVEGLERTNAAVLTGLIETKPGEPLSEEKLGRDLRRIYGRGDFESIGYHVVGDGGPRAVVIEPKEKSWGPDYFRFGLGLASDFKGDNSFNVLMQYRKTWINRLGGEWLSELQIGEDTHFYTELFQPVSVTGTWFVAPSALVGERNRNVFSGDDKVAEYKVRYAQAGLDGGAVLGTWGQLRGGPVWTHIDARVDTGLPQLPTLVQSMGGVRAALFVDQLDYAWFPTAGFGAQATAYAALKSLGSPIDYQRVEASVRGVKSYGPHTFSATLAGGTDLDSGMPPYDSFVLGGPLHLSAYQINQFAGRKYWFGRMMYYNRFMSLPDILGHGIFAGGSAEVGRVMDRFDELPVPGTLWSGSVFLGADTAIGPGYLGVGFGGGGAWSLYLLLGAP